MKTMRNYDAQAIEKKWQEYWQKNNTYTTPDKVSGKENFYALSEFAYPSGNLHVGHWYAFAVPDIYARYKRMSGYNVLYPMGFDAFGLPAENAAIKRGLDPKEWTYQNMEHMKKQLASMGASFDWNRSFATCDPDYYKWTQWMFGEFYKNGIVKRDLTKTNWCESCKTVLANEQVVNGRCERCDNEVIQKDMAQWMFTITDFADELVDDLDTLDWDHSIKQAQREWIGRKEGSTIPFAVRESEMYDVNTGPGDDAFREGEDIVDRNNVVVIVEHPEKDEFLCARWKQVDWQGFVTGGIEEGQSIEETALAEVREETGYLNPKIVKVYDESSHGLFWHVHKKQNRRANYRIVHVKLEDLEQGERSEEEQAIADFLWIPRAEVASFLKREDMRYPWRVVSGETTKLGSLKVFTTRADTLFGVTYLVLAPEHPLIKEAQSYIRNWDEVEVYLKETEKKSDLDRQQSKEKTGVPLKGLEVINPATGKAVPVWVADYVLGGFGTGAVMAVPAHDERDCEFALKYDLPFKFVVLPSAGEMGNSRLLVTSGENDFILDAGREEKKGSQEEINAKWNAMYDLLAEVHDEGGIPPEGKRFCCTFEGKLINGNREVNTKTSEEARTIITKMVGGESTKIYRLRDWGISRQRYWGTPIPVVYDPEGNPHIVPKEHLPWTLPTDVDHTPDGTATFVDSSWYFYRYLDNHNAEHFASEVALKSWMPIDMYFGGAEHTTMHLLYSRFWVKALHKLGIVKESEPYKGRLNRGLILGSDGAKMSKSKGNVIDPDEVVAHVGADTVRMYLAFIGPFNEPGNYPWDPNGVVGVRRFIERVMGLAQKVSDEASSQKVIKLTHKTIKKVSEEVERLKLNTAISSMMTLVNTLEKEVSVGQSEYEALLKIFAAFAPHAAEEIWQTELGHNQSIHLSEWPEYDENLCRDDELTLGVQVNGKVRAEVTIPREASEEQVKEISLAHADVQKWIDGKEIKKFIYVQGRIINIVV